MVLQLVVGVVLVLLWGLWSCFAAHVFFCVLTILADLLAYLLVCLSAVLGCLSVCLLAVLAGLFVRFFVSVCMWQGDVIPKNILMIGPTGCGKTEIARRVAKMSQAPFIKVRTHFVVDLFVGVFIRSSVCSFLFFRFLCASSFRDFFHLRTLIRYCLIFHLIFRFRFRWPFRFRNNLVAFSFIGMRVGSEVFDWSRWRWFTDGLTFFVFSPFGVA